jgi:hypothetical protein
MAKLGMSKGKPPVFTAKLADNDVAAITESGLPPKEFFQKHASEVMAELSANLHSRLDSAKGTFVNKLASEIQVGFEQDDLPILPDNCRHFFANGDHVTMLLETAPQVRTIRFRITGDRATHSLYLGKELKEHYHVAFPYCVFVITAIKQQSRDGKTQYIFERLGIAYRKSPLTGNRNDMLYIPNLHNVGAGGAGGYHDKDSRCNPEKNGYTDSENTFIVCMGSGHSCTAPTLAEIAKRVMDHFWMVHFNGDLPFNFTQTAEREKKVRTMTDWEKHSTNDPLFGLDANWFPGMKLGDLLTKIAATHACQRVVAPTQRSMNVLIGKVYDQVWKDVKNGNLDNGRLATAMHGQLENVMRKFAQKLGQGLSGLPHDSVRRQLQIAIADALKESVK